jgi:hypothetical protein
MADKVTKVSYFAAEVPNRPGQGARLLALAEQGVNLLAFSGFPSGKGTQLDFVPEKAAAFAAAAKRAKIRVKPRKAGFLVQGEDRPGAVAKLLEASGPADQCDCHRRSGSGQRPLGSHPLGQTEGCGQDSEGARRSLMPRKKRTAGVGSTPAGAL